MKTKNRKEQAFEAQIRQLIEGHYLDWEIDKKKLPPVLRRVFSPMRWNLLEWIPCGKADTVVEIGGHYGEFSAHFAELAGQLFVYEADPVKAELIALRCGNADNVVVCSDSIEAFFQRLPDQVNLLVFHDIDFFRSLDQLRAVMQNLYSRFPDSLVLLPCNNPRGLRYRYSKINDASERFTDKLFLSLDDVKMLVNTVAYPEAAIYYPYPETTAAMVLYSDAFPPKKDNIPYFGLVNLEDGYQRDRDAEFTAAKLAASNGTFFNESNSYLLLAGHLKGLDLPSFIKYSNQRRDSLNIRTEIRPGQNAVKKIALSKCGSGHIQKLKKYEEWARRQYEGTLLTLPKGTVSKYIYCYPFLDGSSLMEELDKALAVSESAFQELLCLWQDTVRKAHDISYFSKTREFVSIFGDAQIPPQLRSGSINNVDMVFDNIILQNGKWMVIDTEWTYYFPIPVDYIIYRAFFYYIRKRDTDENLAALCWSLLGIEQKKKKTFRQMELHFQAYILGGRKRFV